MLFLLGLLRYQVMYSARFSGLYEFGILNFQMQLNCKTLDHYCW